MMTHAKLLKECADQFGRYGREHRTKAEGFRHKAGFCADDESGKMRRENLLENAASSDEKAQTNERFAARIAAALEV